MPQRFMLSLHIHRHLFPVEVTPQLPLQVIEVYASISCWEPSTDVKSLLHFPQACRFFWSTARPTSYMTSYRKSRFVRMRVLVSAHAQSSPRINSFNRLERLNHEKRTTHTRRFEPSTLSSRTKLWEKQRSRPLDHHGPVICSCMLHQFRVLFGVS